VIRLWRTQSNQKRRRAAQRGDDETVKRYLAILATLIPAAALAAFRAEIERDGARR
jgi:hypothetical protein